MFRTNCITIFATFVSLVSLAWVSPALPEPLHGISALGLPALEADFAHLPYADPDAPKGGRLSLGLVVGNFERMKLRSVDLIRRHEALGEFTTYDSLLTRSFDEPDTLYGLIAETIDVSEDRNSVTFTLRPESPFNAPVLSEYFELLVFEKKNIREGHHLMGAIEKIVAINSRSLRFDFTDRAPRHIVQLIGLTPIYERLNTDSPFRSSTFPETGPYEIVERDAGSAFVPRVLLRRRMDYWAKDLPIKRGFHNFDEISVEFFHTDDSYFEAFKVGKIDVHFETSLARWFNGYDFSAVQDGRILKEAVEIKDSRGMSGFVFNTRREIFRDARVRAALIRLFHAEWTNRIFYYDAYVRTGSYFQGSTLSALGRPADAAEIALLSPFADRVRPDVMDGTYAPPITDGSSRDRHAFREAIALLAEAGWTQAETSRGSLLVDAGGKPFAFEFLAYSAKDELLALDYANALKLIGITMTIHTADVFEYNRRNVFDFDMLRVQWPNIRTPGTEQNAFWSSSSAETEGNYNYAGVAEPGVDAMITAMLESRDRPAFVAAARALDRLLISGYYVVPLFHKKEEWWGRSARIGAPQRSALIGAQPATWWWVGP